MTTASFVVCLVTCCVSVQAFIVFQEEQNTKFSIVFQDEDVPNTTARPQQLNTNFSKQELECFRKNSVFHAPTATCFQLRAQGPCAKDEWIVLDKDEVEKGEGRLLAVCRKCPCCDQPFTAVFWRADGRCHRVPRDSKHLCPAPGTKLRNDPFGEGECACDQETPHARYDTRDDNAPCYPLYHRGPCDNGYVFVRFENTTRCEKDLCAQKNNGNTGDPFVMWKADNRCYKIGSKGPCPETSTVIFDIDPVTLQAACVTKVLQIIDLPQTCDTDQNGICRKEIALPTQTQYLNDLLQSAQKWRKKRRATRRSKH